MTRVERLRKAADKLVEKVQALEFEEYFGKPAPDSEATPVSVGDMYMGRCITGIGYRNGGIKVGTINVDACYIGDFPVWQGKWPNGIRIRVKESREPGHIYQFTPKGTRQNFGSVGEPSFSKKVVEEDTYMVFLDKNNNSYVFHEYSNYAEAELEVIGLDEDDYVFSFDKERAQGEFELMASMMAC